jgi:hypothetical protein
MLEPNRTSPRALPAGTPGGEEVPVRSLRARSTRIGRIARAAILLVAVVLVAPPAEAATWSVARSPNATQFDNVLWGVDALSPTSAWAVGHADTGTVPTRRPVVLRLNGTTWTSSANPLPPGGGELRDVDALSSTSAWAVGFTNSAVGFDTLVERWNGSTWTIVPSPNVGAQNHLLGVRAFSSTDAWAVGSHNVPGTLNFATLVVRWDGTRWSVVPSPNPQPAENRLQDVDGVASNDLWAVGFQQNDPYGVRQSLILHFDGSTWSTVPTPPALDASLESVVAIASDDVWAIGWRFSLALLWHVPFALHWDGSTWSEVPVPSPSPQGGRLFGLTALSASNLYAVGHSNASGQIPSLIMRWNGSQWSVEPTSSRSTVANLWDAAAATPGTVIAVGNSQQLRRGILGTSRTLILRSNNA